MKVIIKSLKLIVILMALTVVAAGQNLELLSSMPLSNVKAVDVVGNYAYCSFAGGLIILDISDKNQPQVESQLTLTGAGRGVISVSGDYAYVLAGSYPAIHNVDISDPSNPFYISSFGYGGDFFISNNDYVYTADPFADMMIYDVSDPYNPAFVSAFNSMDSLITVEVSGNYAYSAGLNGLHIIDISNPASPFWVGRYPGDYTYWAYHQYTFVLAPYAYVTLPFNGYPHATILIIDISDPTDPTLAGSYNPIEATDIYVSGDYAYAATGNSGFQIIDVSNPAIPTLASSYDTPDNAVGIFAPDEYIYVADNSALLILRFGPPVGCYYTVGDVNGSATYNGLDITYSIMYFAGGEPPLCSECSLCPDWYYCGDVNGSCSFNGMDITYGVLYLRGGAGLVHCPGCPPVG